MEIAYTYWEAGDGWLVGYVDAYPDHLTQGKTQAELEEMLADVYQIRQEEEKRLAQKRKNGVFPTPHTSFYLLSSPYAPSRLNS